MNLGERIKQLRLDKGYTQREVAEKLGVSQPNYAQYENGRRNPKPETLKKIAKAIGVQTQDFFIVDIDGTPMINLMDASPDEVSTYLNIIRTESRISDAQDYDNLNIYDNRATIHRKKTSLKKLLALYEKAKEHSEEEVKYLEAEIQDLDVRIKKIKDILKNDFPDQD